MIGKTFLAGTAIDKAMTIGRTIFAFLSHSFSSSTSALSILHSLIFQITSDNDDMQAALCQSSLENLKSSVTIATTLLEKLLNCAGQVYIVIDGVDEIDEIEQAKLLRHLLDLSKNCEETRILISSRPEAGLATVLDSASTTIRVDNKNAGSIQAFVTWRSQEWFQTRDFLPDAKDEVERLLAPLAANAKGTYLRFCVWNISLADLKGMFLYAKVVLSSIELLTDISDIRQELRVLPENLDAA